MQYSFKAVVPAALAASILSLLTHHAEAVHVYAGIIDTNGSSSLNAGDALSFVGNTTGLVVNGNFDGVQIAPLVTVGEQAGLFSTSNITFTALSKSGLVWNNTGYRAANAFAPTLGSYIELRIDSVTGPAGANFSFWDDGAAVPTVSIPTGTTGGTFAFLLTNDGITYPDQPLFIGDGINDGTGEPPTTPNGVPPVDPFGHIHGRSFVFDQEGTYNVSYILHDRSGIHPDSAPFTVAYTTQVPEPGSAALIGGGALLLGILRRRPGNRA